MEWWEFGSLLYLGIGLLAFLKSKFNWLKSYFLTYTLLSGDFTGGT